MSDMPMIAYEFHTSDVSNVDKTVGLMRARGFHAHTSVLRPGVIRLDVDFDVDFDDVVDFIRYALFVNDLEAQRPIQASAYKAAMLLTGALRDSSGCGSGGGSGAKAEAGAVADRTVIDHTELAILATSIKEQMLSNGRAETGSR